MYSVLILAVISAPWLKTFITLRCTLCPSLLLGFCRGSSFNGTLLGFKLLSLVSIFLYLFFTSFDISVVSLLLERSTGFSLYFFSDPCFFSILSVFKFEKVAVSGGVSFEVDKLFCDCYLEEKKL